MPKHRSEEAFSAHCFMRRSLEAEPDRNGNKSEEDLHCGTPEGFPVTLLLNLPSPLRWNWVLRSDSHVAPSEEKHQNTCVNRLYTQVVFI